MSLMSCSMVRPSANMVRLVDEERLRKRVYACKVFAVGSQRGRVRNWVVFAKKRGSSKRQPWWKNWFSDVWGWPDWRADDVLSVVDRDEELPEDEKFQEWKSKAEAIVELREAQQDVMNSEGRLWEDWIGTSNSAGDSDWGGGIDVSEQITDDPMEIMKEKGFIETFRESTNEDDDDMLFEDRVFEYASTNSAKFLALLILVPWIFDFVAHDYVLMPFLDRYVQRVPLAAELFDVRRSQKLQMVQDLKVDKARFRFEMEIGKSPPLSDDEVWLELREKQLRDEWRLENRKAFANILSDMVYGIVLFLLICFNESKVALLKFTGYKLLSNISDAGKAFLIIMLADISLGYHSESGWHTLAEVVLEHYGLEVNQAAITIFVCVVPVIIDVFVKIWIYRFLPKLSPNVLNILREMKRH